MVFSTGIAFTGLLSVAAVVDTAFLLWLTYEMAHPIIKAQQWKQMALVGKVALLIPANIALPRFIGLLDRRRASWFIRSVLHHSGTDFYNGTARHSVFY